MKPLESEPTLSRMPSRENVSQKGLYFAGSREYDHPRMSKIPSMVSEHKRDVSFGSRRGMSS